MYGFDIVKGKNNKGNLICNSYTCTNRLIDKFGGDKLFSQSEKYIVILDGIILNLQELLQSKESDDWLSTVVNQYELHGDTFFSCFRGSFAGALYDKLKEKWIIFGDQLGTKFLYYSHVDNFFCCSSMMGQMYYLLKENGIEYHLDNDAAKMLLSYGFMLEDYTLCKQVRKIKPGYYIVYSNNKVVEHCYYKLTNNPDYRINEDQAIERIDELFRKAVEKQFKKDNEYGYQHLCALSAGLDCRMTSFVAHSLGYTNQTNITFSQSGYFDDIISKQMATDLGHDWIFKTLDYGNWLKDVDEVNLSTGGNVLYYGTAHGNSLFKRLNFSEFGLIHSGQLGDVTISTHSRDNDEKYSIGDGAYSMNYINDIKKEIFDIYSNKEIGLWYCRYLNGTNNGQQNEYSYSETLSPFLDLDFLEFALSIPLELRYNHYIYKKWIVKKYPEAAQYIWTGIGDKISARSIKFRGQTYSIKVFIQKVIRKLINRNNNYWDSKFNMNPIGYYVKHNAELKSQIEEYHKYVSLIKDPFLRKEVSTIIEKGSSIEQIQIHTLMSALKLFYKNDE